MLDICNILQIKFGYWNASKIAKNFWTVDFMQRRNAIRLHKYC